VVVIREFDGNAPLRDKAIAVGVLFDKLALMRGEATSRSESKDISDDISPTVKRELRRRYAELDPARDDVAREGAEGTTTPAG
jgi:hypothetical protein